MIKSFRAKALARFRANGETRGLRVQNTARLRRILDALDGARRPEATNIPGLDCHRPKGARADTYSVWIRGNWRLTFRWEDDSPADVALEDYR